MRDEKGSVDIEADKRFVHRSNVGIVGACLAFVPWIYAAGWMGMSGDMATMVGLGALAAGGLAFPWAKYTASERRVREFLKLETRKELSGAAGETTVLPESMTPLQKMGARVIELSGEDDHVREMVDGLLGHLDSLQRDAETLRQAIALDEEVLGERQEGTTRLGMALDRKEQAIERLALALRDLHVELTIRDEGDHSATYRRVDDLLATLSAEREVTATMRDREARPQAAEEDDRVRRAAAAKRRTGL